MEQVELRQKYSAIIELIEEIALMIGSVNTWSGRNKEKTATYR